ncbi:MAG: glycosyltransferase family 2 protein [Patescibacteria group bacterium]|nr:glycosyltransferase family 2 protein [Patescibacteria group bacterium]
MFISVIIPAYNEENYIGTAIESVLKNPPPNLLEVVVVNNASTDGTAKIASQFAKVRVVTEPQKGLTRARQRGLLEAKGDILAYIDADSKVPANWLNAINREFQKNPGLVCLSGPYYYYDIPYWQKILVRLYWNILGRMVYAVTKYMAVGGGFAARKEALAKIGGFDTSIEFFGEDTDIARRLHEVGEVKFTNKLCIYTSGRRFAKEGLIRTGLKYVINYTAVSLTKKPVPIKYRDVR